MIAVGHRIAAVLRPTDLLARLGGDEFIAILPATPPAHADAIVHRIQHALSGPISIDGVPLRITASIGIATATARATIEPDQSTTRLLQAADHAMYQAKKAHTITAAPPAATP